MTKSLLIIFLTLSLNFIYGQHDSTGFGISNKWVCVIHRQPVQLEMIEYFKASIDCGYIIAHSLAICKTDKGDTLRVIEFCPGPQNYKSGQKFSLTTYKNITEDKKTYQKYLPHDDTAKERFRYNEIQPTTFGQLNPLK